MKTTLNLISTLNVKLVSPQRVLSVVSIATSPLLPVIVEDGRCVSDNYFSSGASLVSVVYGTYPHTSDWINVPYELRKHYIDVQRREEAFDLSGPEKPYGEFSSSNGVRAP